MTAMTLDTLKYAQRLKEVGVEPAQAEVLAELQFENNQLQQKNTVAHLATKQDVHNAKAELNILISDKETSMLQWIVGTGLTACTITISATAYLLHIMLLH